MPFHIVYGDLLSLPADVYVNSVNTVGVMGAGVALKFRLKYPEMYRDYVKACRTGEISLLSYKGKVIEYKPHIWVHPSRKFIILNMPTKTHWRLKSKYEYVEAAADWLRSNIDVLSEKLGRPVRRIAMPCLGCGLGGLNSRRVIEILRSKLDNLPVEVYLVLPGKP